MPHAPELDLQTAHRHFARQCFNRAWALIDQPDRTDRDEVEMISAAHASLWHWTQVGDHTPRQVSIGCWQLARIYALCGQADNARRYAQRCLDASRTLEPFYVAYGHEGLARAAALADDRPSVARHLAEARRLAALVTDPEEQGQLLQDLDSIRDYDG